MLSSQAKADNARLLGRAMAHEIGHLLLGTTHHASRGLMRGVWTTIDLQKDQPWDWTLSRDDADRMRRGLAARLRRAEPPDHRRCPAKPVSEVVSRNRRAFWKRLPTPRSTGRSVRLRPEPVCVYIVMSHARTPRISSIALVLASSIFVVVRAQRPGRFLQSRRFPSSRRAFRTCKRRWRRAA